MLKAIQTYLFYFLILVYVSGAIGFVVNPSFFRPFTPYTLLLTTLVFLIHQPLAKKNYLLSFSALALLGFVSEVVGVHTGYVFGSYHYGHSLGYKFLGVPLLISLNWALLITCGIIISQSLHTNPTLKAIFSALFVSGLDLLMEQMAPHLDYWYFERGIAGIHNSIGWLVISFSASLLLQKPLAKGNKKISVAIIALQFFFFGLIYLVEHFHLI